MAVTAPPREARGEEERARARVSPLLSRLAVRRPRRTVAGYAIAVLGTATLIGSFLPVRNDITPLSKGFGFLVVVVISAAVGGLGPGILASFLGFVFFNFLFIPPYDTFVIGDAENVVILFVFLGLSILISALLARAMERADAAEAREQELKALQALSAELAAAVPGDETYTSVLTRLVDLFGYVAGALFAMDPGTRELRERVAVGAAPGELEPRQDPASRAPHLERIPLSVGGWVGGLLVLRADRPPLSPAESRVLRAFCDQFALVVERDRLLRAATETEALRQADQVRKSLLAAVSHDLRSPLAAIKASVTDLLAEDAEHGAHEVRDALESIDAESDRLASLVANLLDMSRIEGGMLKAKVQAVDLAEVIAACADRIRRDRPDVKVRVEVLVAPVVRADPVFLDRVVTNLLENAAKAATEGARHDVEIEARRTDGATTVRIIDHGKGVPESVREQLFYPFYQVSERHPRLGTGLGLPISKGFLALMEGEIWIEETPGGGATFAFSLPSADGTT